MAVDERLTAIKTEEQNALNENNKVFDDAINKSDNYYQAQIDASKDRANTQSQLQQEQTDFAIEQIEQQKEQAQKDYTKEQSGAYTDWQKQSNKYGVNAEQTAASGLTGTGYSESSQVSMYNTYQNRVASARESFEQAKLNYNNSITEAKLQNNALLAEIAYNAYKEQLELSLQGFQYKNQLLNEKLNQQNTIKSSYWTKYQNTLDQINTEKSLALQERQVGIQEEQWQAEKEQSANARIYNTGGSSSGTVQNGNQVNTAYYQGNLNRDAVTYGTFSNGYQPKGISGHGTLSKSKKKNGKTETITLKTQTLSGQKQTVIQNVWVADDGTKWYWEGRQNKYIQIK